MFQKYNLVVGMWYIDLEQLCTSKFPPRLTGGLDLGKLPRSTMAVAAAATFAVYRQSKQC